MMAVVLGVPPASPPSQEPSRHTFLQLVSTIYVQGSPSPAELARPARTFPFVLAEKLPRNGKLLSAARSASGRLWLVTDRGAFRSSADGYEPLEVGPRSPEPGQPEVKPGVRVVEVAADPIGHIWVATDRGLYVTDGEQWWQRLDRRDGVPVEAMTCLHLAPNGDAWGGTAEGAWRLRDGQFRYFWGTRWLPANPVRSIRSLPGGAVLIETEQGTACIDEKPMTLAKKAAHFDTLTQTRHNRRGFICSIDLNVPGDASKGFVFHASDNDGLWTALYVGAMACRFGATRDPAARTQARQSLSALLDLERLTGITGFPARSMVTDQEIRAGIHGVNLDARVHAPGEDAKVWFRSRVQPGLWCKGDTSSDELDGQFFAWYLYHELVADPSEKKEIAAVVRRVIDHIIDHGFNLVGHTGRKTRWGIWAPELINHDPFYHDLRPLNSLEILSFLKVAGHITHDAKYARAYDELIEKHHYLLNTLMMRRGAAGQWPDINHSDDELLYLAAYPLLMLEKDPARRRILVQCLARTWERSDTEQGIRGERSPFYNFIYGATTGRACDGAAATETLRDWPWDLTDWTVHNSQRDDIRLRTAPGRHRHRVQLDRVLPASERSQGRWNSSVWTPDSGGEGRQEHDGVAWALGYWLGVYHKFLAADG
jgi:hypothetical protein